ncbi:unnamed protein product [Closterium sp. Yama58-4]|nr:unnamed protein product [Closterium sp. Yama58-4]
MATPGWRAGEVAGTGGEGRTPPSAAAPGREPYTAPHRRHNMGDLPSGTRGLFAGSAELPLAKAAAPGTTSRIKERQEDEAATAGLLARSRTMSLSEHQATEVTQAPVRYAALPKIEVPERFAGTPGIGSSLRNYMMQIRNAQYRWQKDGLDPEDFFRGLSNTVTGEAETAYGLELERLLSEAGQTRGITWEVVPDFFAMLRRHFPVQTPQRMREFAEFRRREGESLLSCYGRLRELASDMECRDERRLVTKFLTGLSKDLAREVRGRIFEMGPEATLEQAYELAKKHELGMRLYEMEKGEAHGEDRRRPAWVAAPTGEQTFRRGDREAESRRCHRCGQEGHLQRDCARPPTCDHCKKEGHLRRDCPELPVCENCNRRGHRTQDCYSRRPGSAGPRSREELEIQLRQLQARIKEMEGGARKEAALLAKEDEGSDGSEAEFVLMVRPPRQRDEIHLRSDVRGRPEPTKKEPRQFRGN